jgi:hypothetical protein
MENSVKNEEKEIVKEVAVKPSEENTSSGNNQLQESDDEVKQPYIMIPVIKGKIEKIVRPVTEQPFRNDTPYSTEYAEFLTILDHILVYFGHQFANVPELRENQFKRAQTLETIIKVTTQLAQVNESYAITALFKTMFKIEYDIELAKETEALKEAQAKIIEQEKKKYTGYTT